MLSSASCNRAFISVRMAASLGRASWPTRWAARAAEEASGNNAGKSSNLLTRVAHLNAQMMAMQSHQLLTGEESKPQKKGIEGLRRYSASRVDASR